MIHEMRAHCPIAVLLRMQAASRPPSLDRFCNLPKIFPDRVMLQQTVNPGF